MVVETPVVVVLPMSVTDVPTVNGLSTSSVVVVIGNGVVVESRSVTEVKVVSASMVVVVSAFVVVV